MGGYIPGWRLRGLLRITHDEAKGFLNGQGEPREGLLFATDMLDQSMATYVIIEIDGNWVWLERIKERT